jgi:hypothetical protein
VVVYQHKKVLIVVKTYPTPARKGVEVSCTAGITEDGQWIRLFPLPFRFLRSEKQFKKYQWIEVAVTKASDPRPDSWVVDLDSIKVSPYFWWLAGSEGYSTAIIGTVALPSG